MGKIYSIGLIVWILVVSTIAIAADRVVIVPLGGLKGNAEASDVIHGITFSSKSGKGITGTLVLPPTMQTFTNTVGMTFNLLPAGTFTMGSPFSEPGRSTDEVLHQVTLTKSFHMQITEVTNKQWSTLIVNQGLGVNPSLHNRDDNYPVQNLNWYEAAYYANILSAWEQLSECYTLTNCTGTPGQGRTCVGVNINANCTGYRLPTEAEWEYAARATMSTSYGKPHHYDSNNETTGIVFNPNLAAMGWYFWNRTHTGGYADETKPVAQKQSNLWGIYDMHGNVGEWCQDLWDLSDYSPDPVTDPVGDTVGTLRVNRGAGWGESAEAARSAQRRANAMDNRFHGRGFRLVRPLGL